MNEREKLDEFKRRVTELLRSSPAQDIEKNLHALASGFFARFDLATREELEVQKALLERAHANLAALEARIAELEKNAK